MARLRQQSPRNYGTSDTISNEFENIIRYLNAGEYGNKTLAELLDLVFDENGQVDQLVQLRKDSAAGLQYRVGNYAADDTESGWLNLISNADLRGESGQNFGEIGAPIIFGRVDYTATASQTVFDYAHTADDELMIYVNGALQVPGGSNDYTNDPDAGTAGQVTFNTGLNLNDLVSIYKIRTSTITGYTRQDTVTGATQTVFPFIHDEATELMVFRNGVLQREGGSFDYVSSAASDTVTFTSAIPAGNLITILTVENTSQTTVTGMMFEANYTNPETGLIKYSKLEIADGDIAQAKVNGLVTALSEKSKITTSASTPSSPAQGDLWVDTSTTPALLKFYDGSNWYQASPDALIPSFTATDALKVVRVNGAGTAYEVAPLDLSSVIPVSQKAAANGVASLDSGSRVPAGQGPLIMAKSSLYDVQASPSNGTYDIQRFFKSKFQIIAISVQTSSGTCDVRVSINGVPIGATFAASSTPNTQDVNPAISVDALTSPRLVSYDVSSVSAAADLEVTLAIEYLAE